MEAAVIGAGGKMGSWFANYFLRRGMQVSIYDIKKSSLKFQGDVKVAGSISACVKSADLVLVCVPVNATPETIKECAKSMKAGTAIAEISSVKQKAFRALKQVRGDLQPLCIHPMFGPGASEKKQAKILLVPVRNKDAELKMVNAMFENAKITVLPNPETHDKSIAIVLGLTYFTNMVFGKVASANNLALLKEVSGTTFGLQSLLAESILTDEPDLIVALIKENPFARRYIKEYLKVASATEKLVSAKSSKGLKADIQKSRSKFQKYQDLKQSYRRLYDIVENLK
ncbi:MAG TPA: prephenate dehydrogenase [Nitrososphaera sp.]|nr:prephenate dehydrogenase [Nitrososphaera sp.]